jgi:hypothetical protein
MSTDEKEREMLELANTYVYFKALDWLRCNKLKSQLRWEHDGCLGAGCESCQK